MRTYRIAVISDLHVGSVFGLLPPKFRTSEGIVQPQNIGQEYLWKCWKDFSKRTKEFAPDAVIVNGDIVDGIHMRDGGAGVILRMTDQKAAAIEVLGEFLSEIKSKCFVIQGTTYHTGENGEAEEDVASTIGATPYASVGSGRLVREVLWLDVGGVILESSHGIGIASGFYRLTALDREMQWSAMSAKDQTKGTPKVDLLIRGHAHHFLAAEHASKQGLVCPCWQLQTKYARKSSVHRFHPDLGGVFIVVDPNAKKKGEAPCEIIKQLYDLPPVPVTKL